MEITERRTVFVSIYRPPGSDFDILLDRITNILNKISAESKHIVLGGDFNIDFNSKCCKMQLLQDLFHSYNCDVTLRSPTKIYGGASSCIDNFVVNMSIELYDVNSIETNISDHLGQLIKIMYPQINKKKAYFYKRNFTKIILSILSTILGLKVGLTCITKVVLVVLLTIFTICLCTM